MPENKGGSYELVQLETLNGGQVVALFERELAKVLENIADENTPAKTTRSITLSIKIKPEDDRGSAVIEVDGHSKLAPVKPSKSFAVFAFDGDRVTAYQNDPRQAKLGLEEPVGDHKEVPYNKASGERQ